MTRRSRSRGILVLWAEAGRRDSVVVRLSEPATLARIRPEIVENLDRRGGADRIQIRAYEPEPGLGARFLSEFAEAWGVDPVEAVTRVLRETDPPISSFNMNEDDIRTFMVQPWTMTSTDGSLPRFQVGLPHPRSYGSFPRKLRRFVIEERVLDLPTAIRSMTSLPAGVLGIEGRGVVEAGAFADLVVFDLDRVRDLATYEDPHRYSEGMIHVLVNGSFAIRDESPTDVRAGRVITR